MLAIAAENEVTVKNLLTAFEGESNANVKYTAFAAQADREGLHGAASLFRAAARAEQIHANNHARAIKQLGGGDAQCEIHAFEVKDTLANLKNALAGELYEVNTMYPPFLEQATAHKVTAAIHSFHGALEAEKTHARLYGQAVKLLEAGKKDASITTAHEFYVCPVCGYTSEIPDEHDRCPVCNAPWKRFEIIK